MGDSNLSTDCTPGSSPLAGPRTRRIAREYGIPAVVATGNACAWMRPRASWS